jgi:type II secretory ATPase GspE/PulE/Tfp pilus assembly ATPase PilB-like protein
VPALIAQYLPVEICIYYQVVPIATDKDTLILGMVEPEDLAALDYVGKLLSFSKLKLEPQPLTFQQQQDLVAYYFSHPPDPAEVAVLAAQMKRSTPNLKPSSLDSQIKTDPAQPLSPSLNSSQRLKTPPAQPTAEKTASQLEGESDETVQQLLNSMLRRALEEKADQIYVEPHTETTCRVRYRQQGILRDLFKDLSDGIRLKLLLSMRRLLGMDPDSSEPSAEMERVYRGETLVLQLRFVSQRSKEAAILNILRGDSLIKYQQNQNHLRVKETLIIAQETELALQRLQQSLTQTLEKLKQYPAQPEEEWIHLSTTLEHIQAQIQMIELSYKDWLQVSQCHSLPQSDPAVEEPLS